MVCFPAFSGYNHFIIIKNKIRPQILSLIYHKRIVIGIRHKKYKCFLKFGRNGLHIKHNSGIPNIFLHPEAGNRLLRKDTQFFGFGRQLLLYRLCIQPLHYTALLCKIIGIHRGSAAVEIIILVILIKKQPKELTHRSILEQMLFQLQSGQRFF